MGIKISWEEELLTILSVTLKVQGKLDRSSGYELLAVEGHNLIINLLSLYKPYDPLSLLELQEQYQLKNIYLVHLWEDIWHSRKVQVIGRIRSIMGLNKRIHGRKTQIVSITQPQADDFLNANHLQASVNTKYKLALVLDQEIVALACFSKLRPMSKSGVAYKSAELVRFANLIGHTVTGGFSKLLKHFIDKYKPDDIMSYADRDWSLGKAYEQASFQLSEVTPPSEIWLDPFTRDRYFPHRLPTQAAELAAVSYIKLYNTGNLKYLLPVRQMLTL